MMLESTPLLLAVVIALIGGTLSFLSPCVLPLVPGYLGFLSGTAVAPGTAPQRRQLLVHALAFVLGFALLFTVVGIAIGAFVSSLQSALDYIRWFGGIAVIILGLHTMGILRIGILQRQAKITAEDRLPRGNIVSSFLLGVFFGAGWTPCVGVILSGIFAVAATRGPRAGLLFFSYALGIGIPFLLVAALFGRMTPILRRIDQHLGLVSAISGIFLIAIGMLLLTDSFTRLAAIGPPLEPPFIS